MVFEKHPSSIVSVIIPTYNRADDLRHCLESLTKQTFKEFEVLVCDDGSTEHISSVVEEFSKQLNITYDYNSHFGGPARPRNRGIKLARGKYLAFLDSDDWWVPEKLEKCLVHFDRGADIVFHHLQLVKEANQKSYRKRIYSLKPNSDIYAALLCRGKTILTSSVIVKTDIMRSIGGFCENRTLIAVEDWDAWLGIARITDKFSLVNECLGYYKMVGGRISKPSLKIVQGINAVYARHINKLSPASQYKALSMQSFVSGRTYFLYGDFEKGMPLLKKSLFGKSLGMVRLKSLLLLIRCYIQRNIMRQSPKIGLY